MTVFGEDGPTFLELAQQALSSTDHGYDLIATKFDATPFRTPDEILEVAVREIGTPRRVLDLCCGTGAAMRALRPHTTEMLVGVDRSRGMLSEAKRRLEPSHPSPHIGLVRADALALPFDGAFDVVTCFGAFGHILEDDEPRFVANVRRALAPGGRFVFVTSRLPPLSSPSLWAARAFNAAMRVRNALMKPEFVMYYLTFHLDRARDLLEREGMKVELRENVFQGPLGRLALVVATR